MTSISFTVPGKPSAWQRAQKFGKHHFTAPRMVAAQIAICAAAAPHVAAPFGADFDGAVVLDVEAVFAIPKSWPAKRKAAMLGQPHAQKPDASNIAKQVEDALNGHAYRDDCQIVDTRCRKIWGDRDGTRVTLTVVE